MLYVLAYDVRDPKRLRNVAKRCLRAGVRVGLSVFEIRFDAPAERDAFLRRLAPLIDPEHDQIRIYRVCENCARESSVLGKSRGDNVAPEEGKAFVF